MNYSAKISIIVPVYNVETYLPECLNSLINQTLLDIEIICVNDGSTDRSLEILNAFAAKDNRIIVIDQENRGVSAARNSALAQANGEIVMFCDSDDMYAPNACERIWREFKEGPTDIVVFSANFFPVLKKPYSWLPWVLSLRQRRYHHFLPSMIFHTPGAVPFLWRNAFRTELLKENNITFSEDISLAEDTEVQLKVFPHAKQEISFLPDRLYQYRWYRPGSQMAYYTCEPDKLLEVHLLVLEKLCKYYKEQDWLQKCKGEFLEWSLYFVVPHSQDSRVKNRQECLLKLKEIFDRYELTGALLSVRGSHKFLAKKIIRLKNCGG